MIGRTLTTPQVLDQGVVLVPFAFKTDGTTDPSDLKGQFLSSVSYTSQGKWTCTLSDIPYDVLGIAAANVEHSADNVDLYCEATVLATAPHTGTGAGTFIVRTKTGSTNTAPPSGAWISGLLVCTAVDR